MNKDKFCENCPLLKNECDECKKKTPSKKKKKK